MLSVRNSVGACSVRLISRYSSWLSSRCVWCCDSKIETSTRATSSLWYTSHSDATTIVSGDCTSSCTSSS
jgi:hypothetical protein